MTETARCRKCGVETDNITEEMCPSCLIADLMAKKKKEEKARWMQDCENGLYDTRSLADVHRRDRVAVECARRVRAFALGSNSYPYPHAHDYHAAREKAIIGNCFLLISWGGAVKGWKQGKLQDPSTKYCKESRTVWANCTPEYYDNCVAPLVHRFNVDELQETFKW